LERALHDLSSAKAAFLQPRVLVCDVDGTLTDGGMYYGADGDLYRKFNTRDAKGLSLLREAGLRVMILSTENSPITEARARKLSIEDCFVGVEDKLEFVTEWVSEAGLDPKEIAYIGDDVNDLAAMEYVGWTACPQDAVDEITATVDHVCRKNGGAGAVREFCELILKGFSA
jgi:N-acylneuraminate cytidylyltransferase